MIQILYDERNCRLTVSGHAGAGPKGGDLVCAAVSALGWTLLAAAMEDARFHACCALDGAAGLLDLRCAPEPAARRRCRYLLRVFAAGLESIAEQYPEYVKIEKTKGALD